jgi:hypothetical protein
VVGREDVVSEKLPMQANQFRDCPSITWKEAQSLRVNSMKPTFGVLAQDNTETRHFHL